MGGLNPVIQPETLGDLRVCRISQNHFTAADQHRHIGGRHVKAIEQLLGVRLTIEIDEGMRMAVASQKLLGPTRAGAIL